METNDAVKKWIEGWSRGWKAEDAEGIGTLYAADATFRSHPFREPHEGSEGAAGYARWSFEEQDDVDVWFGEAIVDGDRATVEYWAVITHQGAEQTLAGISVLRFDPDGLVVSQRDYWSMEDGRRSPNEGWGK
jgi:ketosteroid isomerase-like protein